MDEHFYRGAQPEPNDYTAMAALGIKTVIDLRDDPTSYEKSSAEAAGMRYVNIPMSDKRKPANDKIEAFLAIANDESSMPVYVHCVGGRHRTGLIGAIYRFNRYGWDFDAGVQRDEKLRLLLTVGTRRDKRICAGVLWSDEDSEGSREGYVCACCCRACGRLYADGRSTFGACYSAAAAQDYGVIKAACGMLN